MARRRTVGTDRSMAHHGPTQRCKHCGKVVVGTAVAIMGFGSTGKDRQPFAYRFDCPGPHERLDQETVWLSAEPGSTR